jgi:hypothetical protein
MIIKFKKEYWNKFIRRQGGIKHAQWFAFDNSFFFDPSFYDFTPDELLTAIYLMCEASRSNKNGELFISKEHHKIHCRVQSREQSRVLSRTVSKLQQRQVIEQPRDRGAFARIEENRIEENRIDILPDSTNPEIKFDFEILYKKYPRKEGKTRGIAICKTQVKTQEDYDLLSKAIDVYISHCIVNKTEPRFVKHFSSFMTTWRDWLSLDIGPSSTTGFNLERSQSRICRAEKMDEQHPTNPKAKELAEIYAKIGNFK